MTAEAHADSTDVIAEYLKVYRQDPDAIAPGASMRSFDLWDEERAAFVGFVESRKESPSRQIVRKE